METTLVKTTAAPVDEFKANYFGIEWIETESLFVDPNYQRPVKHTLVKSISKAWDWRAVRTLAISLRSDGTYAVMDGQQRLTAARECNIVKLPCQVYIDLTEKQEAELFLKLNNSSKPNSNDMFRAKLAEGDQEAKLIAMAVNNCNWELNLEQLNGGNSRNPQWCATTVNSAVTLINIYQQGGVLHLQQVLNMAHGWYGQHLAGSADILSGLSIFLMKYKGKIDMSRLSEKLADDTPHGILGKAIQILAAERALGVTGQSTRYKAVSKVIAGIYNKGLRPANRLEE